MVQLARRTCCHSWNEQYIALLCVTTFFILWQYVVCNIVCFVGDKLWLIKSILSAFMFPNYCKYLKSWSNFFSQWFSFLYIHTWTYIYRKLLILQYHTCTWCSYASRVITNGFSSLLQIYWIGKAIMCTELFWVLVIYPVFMILLLSFIISFLFEFFFVSYC